MKKKGFTLIELLAIIVILAIIALIAVPVVLNIINKARVSSYARSSENVLEAARLYYNEYKLDNTTDIKGNQYDTIKATLSGELPDSGEVYIKEDGKIALALTYGNYCYIKNYEDKTFEKSEITDGECTIKTGITVETLKSNIVTTGDGLYLDSDEVYRYKGENPNNYITIGEETYRIIAIEEQGIKVINVSNPIKSEFDIGIYSDLYNGCPEECTRNNSNNTYCQDFNGDWYGSYYGCNIYAKASEIKQNGVISDIITVGSYSGTVTETSTAYKVLHEYYNNTLSELEKHIVTEATWNVGPIDLECNWGACDDPYVKHLNDVIDEEKAWTWTGKIGLISASEYVQAGLENSCYENVASYEYCYLNKTNWLNPYTTDWSSAESFFTINPSFRGNSIASYKTLLADLESAVVGDAVDGEIYLRQVIYLKSDIQLTGSGSPTDTYKIVES